MTIKGRFGAATFILAGLALTCTGSRDARADEGLWPFNMAPKERIQKDHNVAITDAWLDHVRLSSVLFGGASGSFVSPNGLVLTNHHVGAGCIDRLGRAGKDYLTTGYLAGKDGPEAKCSALEVSVLLSIEDVTEKVRAARKPDMNDADANTAMKGAMSELEKSCAEKAGLRCNVVTLYAGGKYDLYTYKKYTDVRLVFAPEQDMASFGGDPDNLTYPRYDFDMALFRVYENGQPIHPKEYLSWSPAGPKDGETVFLSGHPETTGRLATLAQLATFRDKVYPAWLERRGIDLQRLRAFGRESNEAAREVQGEVNFHENIVKVVGVWLRSLKDPALLQKKAADEAQLRQAIDADPKLKQSYASLFDEVAATQKKQAELYQRYFALERPPSSRLLGFARTLVRLPAELDVPNEKRLREYNDSNLASLKDTLFSPAPVYGGMEVVFVRSWLERLVRALGPGAPTVKAILAGRTPERAARELVAGSKLFDVYARQKLEAGGKQAIAESTDPAIALMRSLDPEARAIRKRSDDEVEGPSRKQGERIAQAVFAVRGTSLAPDATGTLRLSVGVVKGYTENGKSVPWTTNVAGLYAHATGAPPLKLSERWVSAKTALRPDTPFNFVSTVDHSPGNSGSPVVNAKGEFVGLLFDGNLTSFGNQFVYGEVTQRSVSVHPHVILEALSKVYGATELAQELAGSTSPSSSSGAAGAR